MDRERRERNTSILEWFDALVFALLIVLVMLLFFVRTVNVNGASMEPTLYSGDRLLARSIFYEPQRGDIVVVDGYTSYGQPLVKRVIGLEGDEINIDLETNEVYVNGEKLNEPYISSEPISEYVQSLYDVSFPLTVPEGKLFLMGDNRPNSKDSRHSDIGFIDERDILGEVIFRILPIDDFGTV